MKMSFFAMPLAQTWFARTAFKATDTILLTNQDDAHIPSHLPIPPRSRDGEGRPPMVQSSGHFKMVYIYGAMDSKAYGAINHFETTQ